MSYNKINYWGNRVDPNNDFGRNIAPHQVKWISSFIDPSYNILDYGPGVGRVISSYKNLKHISFYDISETYKTSLESKCNELGLSIKDFVIDTSGKVTLPFLDNEFDIVTSTAVLLHVPEEEIIKVMNELARVGKKVLVITYYSQGKTLHPSEHVWTRDYKKILKNSNMKLLKWEENLFPNQVAFLYSK